jgi:type I restriction enzyme M protein
MSALKVELGLNTDDEEVASAAVDRIAEGLSAKLKKPVSTVMSVRDPNVASLVDKKGRPLPDPDLRDSESIPLLEDDEEYFKREVAPFVDDAWMDHKKVKIGYEVPFTRIFFQPAPRRSLEEVAAELRRLESEVEGLLPKVVG